MATMKVMKAGDSRSAVVDLKDRFLAIRSQLQLIDTLEADLCRSGLGSTVIEATLEQRRDRILDEMKSISEAAARTTSRSIEELRDKAWIWLERYIPESNDDVANLAASICRDVLDQRYINREIGEIEMVYDLPSRNCSR